MFRPSPGTPDPRLIAANAVLHAFLTSRFWKAGHLIRRVLTAIRPARFGANNFHPIGDVRPNPDVGPGAWEATGAHPQFLAPGLVPAGWLRVRLSGTGQAVGGLQLEALPADPEAEVESLQTIKFDGPFAGEFFVRLRRPALGLCLRLLDGPGQLWLDRLDVQQTTALAAALHHLRRPRAEVSSARSATGERPAVVYVLLAAGLNGGVRVVLEHVSRLRARGWDAQVWYVQCEPSWFERPLLARRFGTVAGMRQALDQFRGIKVATWYETAPWVTASLREGDRGFYLVQDIEDHYALTPAQAADALATYQLPLQPLTEGAWVHHQLRTRFRLTPAYVGLGVDFDVFAPGAAPRDSQCILTQSRTWAGGGPEVGDRLKGWATARSVALRCKELNARTTLKTFSIEGPPALPADLIHGHVLGPTDAELADLYRTAGLYLLTSTHEGFGLTAAEAMACGCPVVATRADGNEEFCLDGTTALTAAPGDVERLARHVVRLQADPDFAADLGRQGQQFIQGYTWDRVIDQLEGHYRAPREGATFLQREVPALPRASQEPVLRPMASSGEHPPIALPAEDCDWTLVIPTLNDFRQVSRCVRSCREFAPAGGRVQFVVVDDGTTSADILDNLHQAGKELNFELVRNHQNLGFSATINQGLRHARGRLIVLCNNDVVFDQAWMEPLRRAFAADPLVGIVGARLRYPDGTLQHSGMDKRPGQLRFQDTWKAFPADHPPALRSRYAWAVTGALMALRRETVRRLGGFSTGYTLTYEDVDYCMSAWSQGIRVWYAPEVSALHLEASTRGKTPGQKYARSILWAERERNSEAYFDGKWHAFRYVRTLEELLSRSPKQTPVGAAA